MDTLKKRGLKNFLSLQKNEEWLRFFYQRTNSFMEL